MNSTTASNRSRFVWWGVAYTAASAGMIVFGLAASSGVVLTLGMIGLASSFMNWLSGRFLRPLEGSITPMDRLGASLMAGVIVFVIYVVTMFVIWRLMPRAFGPDAG